VRILITNYRDRTHPLAGGAEAHLHEIFGRLVRLGHPVMLLTTSYQGAKRRETVDGISVVRVGGDLAFQWTVFRQLPRLEKEFRPDIVVEDLNKLPVFTRHLSHLPNFVQIHHLWGGSIFRETWILPAFAVWAFERLIPYICMGSRFAAVSPSAVRELTELGVCASQISLIYNGTDESVLALEPPRQKKPYFLWLGRIRKYKGVWVAIEAFREFAARHPEGELWIAGSGPEEARVRRKIKEWKIEGRVRLLGVVDSQERVRLMREAIAILQTSYKEGWGLTVIEAAACGTPAIASDTAGLCDSVLNGKTGLLFEAGKPHECCLCMEKLEADPDLAARLGGAARSHARNFSWDKAAEETLQALQATIQASEARA
jgi:glycosyltransferase involved in cell wall biosynthesis